MKLLLSFSIFFSNILAYNFFSWVWDISAKTVFLQFSRDPVNGVTTFFHANVDMTCTRLCPVSVYALYTCTPPIQWFYSLTLRSYKFLWHHYIDIIFHICSQPFYGCFLEFLVVFKRSERRLLKLLELWFYRQHDLPDVRPAMLVQRRHFFSD